MEIKFTGQCLGIKSYTNEKGVTYLSANLVDKATGTIFEFGCNKVSIPAEILQVQCEIKLDVIAERKFNRLFVDIQDAHFKPVKE